MRITPHQCQCKAFTENALATVRLSLLMKFLCFPSICWRQLIASANKCANQT
ncbi:unnamed protein product [Meloidogyne enterolobii]|uniref:Uncharacterized protein n=1 Tax=Meloidogyne enterolobii TaxID=390850 RepID=A0ACB0YS07_MELEN